MARIYNRTHTIQWIVAEAHVEGGEEGAQGVGGTGGGAEELAAHLGQRRRRQQFVEAKFVQQQLHGENAISYSFSSTWAEVICNCNDQSHFKIKYDIGLAKRYDTYVTSNSFIILRICFIL